MVKARKSFSVVVLVLVLCLGMVAVPMASTVEANPGEIHVGPGQPYATIQAAIDAASAGDTINVAVGTYEENIEIPDDKINLFLIGADRETTVISGSSATGPVVIIMADSVNFEGFTVQGGTTGSQGESGYGVGIFGASYCVINDNITTENEIGICVIGGTVLVEGEPVVLVSDNNLISHNEIHGNPGTEMAYGIMLFNCSGTTITENEIYDNGVAGIGIMGGKADMDGDGEWDILGECLDNRILGNELYGHTLDDMGAGGILIWNASNNTVSGNNEIYENIVGVTVVGWTGEEYGFEGEATANSVSDNNIHGNTNCGIGIFGFDENCYGNSIMGNTIEDSGDGIWILGGIDTQIVRNDILNNIGEMFPASGIHVAAGVIDGFVLHSPGTEIHHNNIEGNLDYGVYNEDTEIIDATNNWWGDASGPSGVGPGTGDAVSDNVNYDPWLDSPVSADDILAYYRGLGLNPNVVETTDLLKAIGDWAGGTIPPGFSQPLTTLQLLQLIGEWAGGG